MWTTICGLLARFRPFGELGPVSRYRFCFSPNSPNRDCVWFTAVAGGGHPVHFFTCKLLVDVLPGYPLFRVIRNVPFGRHPRSNSSRHEPSLPSLVIYAHALFP